MTRSSPSLFLLLLLALWTAPYLAARAGTGASDHGLTHIHLYMPLGADATFGAVGVLDDELRDGPDAGNSSLVGRYQGLFVSAGLVSPPGAQSAINLVFTAGEHRGSTLAMLGPMLSFTSAIERAVVGGTGAFRMARGF
uniref:Dirigent protein n=1 Tax=Aegilops tauschii TaxID=37682 RepID=M8BQK9_AEGTA